MKKQSIRSFIWITLGLTLCLSLFSGCGKVKKIDTALLEGEWITGCLDMGGGSVNRIYGKFADQKGYVAILTFSGADCSGVYSMTDTQGNPITKPTYSNDVVERSVLNIPDGFRAYTVTQVSDSSVINILMYFNGSSFTELVSNAAYHEHWNDWMSEPDVSGFANAPETYTPIGGGLTLKFSRGTLP